MVQSAEGGDTLLCPEMADSKTPLGEFKFQTLGGHPGHAREDEVGALTAEEFYYGLG